MFLQIRWIKSNWCNHFTLPALSACVFVCDFPHGKFVAVGYTCRWSTISKRARVEKSFTSYSYSKTTSCGHSGIIQTSGGGELGISGINFVY